MAVSLTRFSWWVWKGKEKNPVPNGNSSTTDLGSGLREVDSVKFAGTKHLASPRKVKRKWHSREERRAVDSQYGDAVLVPSDGGGCLSGSESDGPDWSIGWVEPHGPEFRSDDETDDGFAVLVPCYKPGCKELVANSNHQILSAIRNLQNEFSSADGKNSMQWLSSLQNF